RLDPRRRRGGRGREDAALLALARAARALPLRDARGTRGREVRRRRVLRRAPRADAARLALDGAGGGVTASAVTRREPSLGWWGMALFVAAEATLFGVLVATYFYLRFKNLEWPPQGIPEPKLGVPLVLLGVLLVTSVPMQLALRAANAHRLGAARLLLGLASIVQAGYFAMQVHEYAGDLGRFAPPDHADAPTYYTPPG